jgi:hypothetical protein
MFVMALLATLCIVYQFPSPLKQSTSLIFCFLAIYFVLEVVKKQSWAARNDPPNWRLSIETKRPITIKYQHVTKMLHRDLDMDNFFGPT